MKGHPTARIIPFLLVLTILLAALTSCGNSSPTVLTVGEEEVSYDLLRYFVMNHRAESGYTSAQYSADETLQNELIEQVNTSIREVMAYQALANEHNIGFTKDEEEAIKEGLDSLRTEYGSDEAMAEALAEGYLTEDVYLQLQRLQALASKVYELLTNEQGGILEYNEDTVRADVQAGNFFSAEYLYIYYVESDKAEKTEFADELYDRLLAGESMQALNDEYSATYGLSMDYVLIPAFTYTQETADFEEAVTALEVGAYTQPIVRGDGILIARRLEVSDTYVEQNLEEIISSYREREFAYLVQAQMDKMDITFKKKYESLNYWEME